MPDFEHIQDIIALVLYAPYGWLTALIVLVAILTHNGLRERRERKRYL